MKATLSFDLNQDQYDFRCAIIGSKVADVLSDIRAQLRVHKKHCDVDNLKQCQDLIERIKLLAHSVDLPE